MKTLNQFVNESKKRLIGVNTWTDKNPNDEILIGLNEKYTKIYKKLSKPVNIGKTYKVKFSMVGRPGVMMSDEEFRVIHIISNDVKTVNIGRGNYRTHEHMFIKDIGILRLHVKPEVEIPEELLKYFDYD